MRVLERVGIGDDKKVAEGLAKECGCRKKRKNELAWLRHGKNEILIV